MWLSEFRLKACIYCRHKWNWKDFPFPVNTWKRCFNKIKKNVMRWFNSSQCCPWEYKHCFTTAMFSLSLGLILSPSSETTWASNTSVQSECYKHHFVLRDRHDVCEYLNTGWGRPDLDQITQDRCQYWATNKHERPKFLQLLPSDKIQGTSNDTD